MWEFKLNWFCEILVQMHNKIFNYCILLNWFYNTYLALKRPIEEKKLSSSSGARTHVSLGSLGSIEFASIIWIFKKMRLNLGSVLKIFRLYLLSCQAKSAILGRYFCTGQQQLWRGSVNFKIKSLDHFLPSFLSKKW